MPKKLQIKLLSQSAELLNVTNCLAGQVSVLRSESPSELKPYQRALSGVQSRERFVITVDGSEYNSDHHNVIGFGEVAPHSGLTVSAYLASAGIVEGAISGLLNSFGLEGVGDKVCSSLSPDEERKVRLFAATADPSKALIINEPFEPISSQWRANVADLLLDFATSKNGLVVIPSLSYRPDAWVDNQSIIRHQVGQSLRRTIGFGSANSESTTLMNQIRDLVRDEPPPPHQVREGREGASLSLSATTLGLAQGALSEDSTSGSQRRFSTNLAKGIAIKALGAAALCGFIVWGTVKLIPERRDQFASGVTDSGNLKPSNPQGGTVQGATLNGAVHPADGDQRSSDGTNMGVGGTQRPGEPVKVAFVLDKYPASIRQSILNTAHGILGDTARAARGSDSPKLAAPSSDEEGSLYKLLEKAGTEGASGDDQSIPSYADPAVDDDVAEIPQLEPDADPDQEARREEIRQKFLQAIQAAAQNQDE